MISDHKRRKKFSFVLRSNENNNIALFRDFIKRGERGEKEHYESATYEKSSVLHCRMFAQFKVAGGKKGKNSSPHLSKVRNWKCAIKGRN